MFSKLFAKKPSVDETPWTPSKRYIKKRQYKTKQSQQADQKQVPNDEGGFVYEVNDWTKLKRFLILGTDQTLKYTYSEHALIRTNAQCIDSLLAAGDGVDVVNFLKDMSVTGQTPKQHTILFGLAICVRSNLPDVKKAAYEAVDVICRVPTHLFLFLKLCNFVETMSSSSSGKSTPVNTKAGSAGENKIGWGRAHKRAICRWYENRATNPLVLARLITKYTRRCGWTHYDVFCLSHIRPKNANLKVVVRYIICGLEKAKSVKTDSEKTLQEKKDNELKFKKDITDLEDKMEALLRDKNSTASEKAEVESQLQDKGNERMELQTDISDQEKTIGEMETLLEFLEAAEEAKYCVDENRTAELIRKHSLEKEHVNTQVLNSPIVWQALAETMGMTALLRNLNKLTRLNVLKYAVNRPRSILEQLENAFTNSFRLKEARIHPLSVLQARQVYKKGRNIIGSSRPSFGWYSRKIKAKPEKDDIEDENVKEKKVKEKKKWTADDQLLGILDDAFYLSFGGVQRTGKRFLMAIDVGGKKGRRCLGNATMSFTDVAAAFALYLMKIESAENCQIVTFSDKLKHFDVQPDCKLEKIIKDIRAAPKGEIDCAMPMIWATEEKKKFDVFIVITTNQTYYGGIHPKDALREYRQKLKMSHAKLIVIATASNFFTIASPNDDDMLDMAGFPTHAFDVISKFVNDKV